MIRAKFLIGADVVWEAAVIEVPRPDEWILFCSYGNGVQKCPKKLQTSWVEWEIFGHQQTATIYLKPPVAEKNKVLEWLKEHNMKEETK